MPALVIKNLPPELHRRLKERARNHHRSMTQEAIEILENALQAKTPPPWPPPLKGTSPITNDFIDWAKRQGRP